MWNRLEDLNPSFLEHRRVGYRRIFSSPISHPALYFLLVFVLNHCQKLSGGRKCGIFGAQIHGPGMGGVIVIEDN
jgi:hypothetical protein